MLGVLLCVVSGGQSIGMTTIYLDGIWCHFSYLQASDNLQYYVVVQAEEFFILVVRSIDTILHYKCKHIFEHLRSIIIVFFLETSQERKPEKKVLSTQIMLNQ